MFKMFRNTKDMITSTKIEEIMTQNREGKKGQENEKKK